MDRKSVCEDDGQSPGILINSPTSNSTDAKRLNMKSRKHNTQFSTCSYSKLKLK
jgi:hypothetical protein